ncbi:MAG: hypothetical protein ACRELZ_21825 [Candidatus Rokuibacteriota bacterium]
MRRRALLLAVAALVAASAQAQAPDRPTPESFRIEWVRRSPSMRPGVDGYLYNDSRWRVTNIRVRAVVVDAAGATVRESSVAVWGNSVPGTRTFFVLPSIREGEIYQLTVATFDLISEQTP